MLPGFRNLKMNVALLVMLVSGCLGSINLALSAENISTNLLPVISISADEMSNSRREIVVAISAGHGGDDPGAVGIESLQEKNVVLAIAQKIASQLEGMPGYRAVLIRDDDYYVDLRHRIDIAHANEADLFIAIHTDAADTPFAQGATVYALSTKGATSEQASRLASKENSADLRGGTGLVSLRDKPNNLAIALLGLAFNGSIAISLEIGDLILEALNQVTEIRRSSVEQAAFIVLKSADIPSLLIETGYITNPDDAKKLKSAPHQQQLANAIVAGITRYFNEIPPRGTWVFWQKEKTDTQNSFTNQKGVNVSRIVEFAK